MTNEQLAELIHDRFDRIEASLHAETDELRASIDDLSRRCEDAASAAMARIDQHEEYHRNCEHRWGLIRLAGRHPFRFAAAAAAALLLTNLGGESAALVSRIVELLAGADP